MCSKCETSIGAYISFSALVLDGELRDPVELDGPGQRRDEDDGSEKHGGSAQHAKKRFGQGERIL